jgi:hypothetical protein
MNWELSTQITKLRALKADQNPLVSFINLHS